MAANDKQIGGSHYKTNGLEHWDMVVHFKLDYFQGQITKYVMRWRDKGGISDLEKAQHFLEKYMEVAKKEQDAMDQTIAEAKEELGPGWNVRREGTRLVASYGGKASPSKRVSRRKVPSTRKE